MNSPDPITRLNAALQGRYRIERQIGEGGMATVYLADDLKHERNVARERFSYAALLALVALGIFACDSTGPDPLDEIASVTVTPTAVQLDIGSTAQLSAQVANGRGEPVTAIVTWSASSTDVATVSSSGFVTGIAEGAAIITAVADGQSGTAAVTVTDPNPPQEPSSVQATPVSDTEIVVTWTDNSTNEDEFVIERRTGAGSVASAPSVQDFVEAGRVGPNVTTFRDTGLVPAMSYRYRVTACNENGCPAPSEMGDDSATYETLIIETTTLSSGTVSQAYSQSLAATGGDGSYTWAITSGALPPGLSLNAASGLISGTPTTAITSNFTVEVTSAGLTVTKALGIVVNAPVDPPTITTSSLTGGSTGVAYEATLGATGGDDTYRWWISAGALPSGLTLNGTTGAINGTPTIAGTSNFTVQVLSAGETATRALSINVLLSLRITTTSLPVARVDEPYEKVLEAMGGAGSKVWSGGEGLQRGLSLSPEGVIGGTPEEGDADQTRTISVRVSDSSGGTDSKNLALTLDWPEVRITTTSLLPGVEGEPYADTMKAYGGKGRVTWSRIAGELPPGLGLASGSGLINGSVGWGTAGQWRFTINARDSDGSSPELCVKVRGSSSMLRLGCLGDLLGLEE